MACKPKGVENIHFPNTDLDLDTANVQPFTSLIFTCTGTIELDLWDVGVLGSVSTMMTGRKVIVSWPPTPQNLELFSLVYGHNKSWNPTMLYVIHAMEKPNVNVLEPGQSVYTPAGQLHVSFSYEASIMHRFATANWHVSEVDRIETIAFWMKDQIFRMLRERIEVEVRYFLEVMQLQL